MASLKIGDVKRVADVSGFDPERPALVVAIARDHAIPKCPGHVGVIASVRDVGIEAAVMVGKIVESDGDTRALPEPFFGVDHGRG